MGNFALALYTPVTGTPYYGGYDPSLPSLGQMPLAGVFGGAYQLTWYTDLRDPNEVQLAMAAPIGTDGQGHPIVRGYDHMLWGYSRLRPDEWYYLYNLQRLVRRTSGTAYAGRVRLQWPDPQSGVLQTASARWLPPAGDLRRSLSSLEQLTLEFTHLGVDDVAGSVTGIWQPTA